MGKKNKKKNKGGGVKKLIRQAGPNISKKEMKKIIKAAGGNVRKAVNRIASVQRSQKKAGKVTTGLGSKASNMLIRKAAKAPATRYDPKGPFGTSKLGQTLQSMTGVSSRIGVPNTERQKVAPGMSIRLGGGIGPKKRPRQTFDTTGFEQTIADLTNQVNNAGAGTGAGLGIQDILDSLGSFEMPTVEMPDYSGMFDGMFDDLSSQFDINDPLQLAALGQAYGGDLIRARQRQRKTRADYLRNRLGLSFGGANQALAPMMFGGGLTL